MSYQDECHWVLNMKGKSLNNKKQKQISGDQVRKIIKRICCNILSRRKDKMESDRRKERCREK